METFIGTKVVSAEPEQKDGRQGFRVVYEDGYTSWSPKDVFEKAYSHVSTLPFHAALYALIEWSKEPGEVFLRRTGWNGKGMRVVMVGRGLADPEHGVVFVEHAVRVEPFMLLIQPDGRANTWVPSISDLLATDWCVVSGDA